jgi:hypothetical protein
LRETFYPAAAFISRGRSALGIDADQILFDERGEKQELRLKARQFGSVLKIQQCARPYRRRQSDFPPTKPLCGLAPQDSERLPA